MQLAPTTDVSIVNINHTELRQTESQRKLKANALKVGIILSYVGNVVLSYLIMKTQNILISEKYFIYIVPRQFFFKIWIVIYVTLTLMIIHNLWKNIWKTKSSLIFILSNVLGIVSTAIWSIKTPGAIAISGCVLAFVCNTAIWFWRVLMDEYMQDNKAQEQAEMLQNINSSHVQDNLNGNDIQMQNPQNKKSYTKWQLFIVRNILSFYIGWLSVAGTVIIGLTMVYVLNFSKCLQFILFWITTPIAAMTIFSFMAFKVKGQFKYCIGFLLSALWGVSGAILASVDNIVEQSYC